MYRQGATMEGNGKARDTAGKAVIEFLNQTFKSEGLVQFQMIFGSQTPSPANMLAYLILGTKLSVLIPACSIRQSPPGSP